MPSRRVSSVAIVILVISRSVTTFAKTRDGRLGMVQGLETKQNKSTIFYPKSTNMFAEKKPWRNNMKPPDKLESNIVSSIPAELSTSR